MDFHKNKKNQSILSNLSGFEKNNLYTECLHVSSSKKVAEIIGKQGYKIKALRSKTNTFIKSPVCGEMPVFVITGCEPNVKAAIKEILFAIDYNDKTRKQRELNKFGYGEIQMNIRVPSSFVGLLVGSKGITIKRIQHNSGTFIITPHKNDEPIFQVYGFPENVDIAKTEIESHIVYRTGVSLEISHLIYK